MPREMSTADYTIIIFLLLLGMDEIDYFVTLLMLTSTDAVCEMPPVGRDVK